VPHSVLQLHTLEYMVPCRDVNVKCGSAALENCQFNRGKRESRSDAGRPAIEIARFVCSSLECAGFPPRADLRDSAFESGVEPPHSKECLRCPERTLILTLFLTSGGSRRPGTSRELLRPAVLGPALHSFSEGGTARPT